MASTFNISNLAASTSCDAIAQLLSGGTIAIYTAPQPAQCDLAVTNQMKLAECVFGSPAYQAAVSGAALSNAIAPATALANGTAAWFRLVRSNGSVVGDGSVGTSGCDLNLDSTAIQAGALVTVTSLPLVERKS